MPGNVNLRNIGTIIAGGDAPELVREVTRSPRYPDGNFDPP